MGLVGMASNGDATWHLKERLAMRFSLTSAALIAALALPAAAQAENITILERRDGTVVATVVSTPNEWVMEEDGSLVLQVRSPEGDLIREIRYPRVEKADYGVFSIDVVTAPMRDDIFLLLLAGPDATELSGAMPTSAIIFAPPFSVNRSCPDDGQCVS